MPFDASTQLNTPPSKKNTNISETFSTLRLPESKIITEQSELANEALSRLRHNYERIRRSAHRDLQLCNFSPSKIKESLDSLEIDFCLAETALIKCVDGGTVEAVAKQTGVSPTTLRHWLDGTLPHALQRADSTFRKYFTKPIEIPRAYSEEFAYVLGACAGATAHGPVGGRLTFHDRDRTLIDRLSTSLANSIKTTPKLGENTIDGDPYFKLQLISAALTRHINRVTNFNTRVPWEHLETVPERIAFAKGLFDWSGSVSVRVISMEKKENVKLIREVGVLLFTLGIYPLVTDGARSSLVIADRLDIENFSKKIGFCSKAKQRGLTSLCDRPSLRKAVSPETYFRILNRVKEKESIAQIARSERLSASAVRDITEHGVTPKSVERYNKLKSYHASIPGIEQSSRSLRALSEHQIPTPDAVQKCGINCHPTVLHAARTIVGRWNELAFPEWSAEQATRHLYGPLRVGHDKVRLQLLSAFEALGAYEQADLYRELLSEISESSNYGLREGEEEVKGTKKLRH